MTRGIRADPSLRARRCPERAKRVEGIYVLDGTRFETLEEFYDEVSRVLIPGAKWGRNLDAFNDILRGGFGTPPGGFVLRWTHSNRSRRRLNRFNTIVELILIHGEGGREAGDGVELQLA